MTTTDSACAEAPRFSVIVPVYNRPDEMADLMASLASQTCHDFEAVIVEDGSTVPCRDIVRAYAPQVPTQYIAKPNEGRSIARNYGMEAAKGRYFVFFDSDCVIPPTYFETLGKALDEKPLDCYGGPDAAHDSFSDTQKAINYSMTSLLTTGGIRGGKVSLEKFTPRTFNMGFARKVYDKVGGFREMFSEDIDMSTRIRQAGFSIGLIRQVPVWHKRRVSMGKFFRQVYVFGMSRITLKLLYPGSLKLVHMLPALFVLGVAACVVLGCTVAWWFLLFPCAYLLAVLVMALISTRSPKVALLSVPAAVIQLGGYGIGFIKAWVTQIAMGRGRDLAKEVEMRKGK